MTDVDVTSISDEELMEFLDKREQQAAKRREYAAKHPDKNAWNRQKARMEQDPEYADKVKQQRKAYTAKRNEREKAKMAADPEYAQKVREQRNAATRARNAKIKALLDEAKARGLVN